MGRRARRCLAIALFAAALSGAARPDAARAAPIEVRYAEGVTHGFLVVRGAGGEVLADGDLVQVAKAEGVESRLTFRFRDGSLHEETVVFTQQRVFAMRRYRLVQRGPTFPEQVQVSLERETGRYEVRSRRGGDDEKVATGDVELPADVYNGLLTMLLKNLARGAGETVHLLAFTPKPILIQLEITPRGEDTVLAGERRVPATHYVIKPKLGLVRGAAAAVLGKTPPDYHCWIATGGAPAFVAIDGPLYTGGPIWRIETVSPRGPGRAPLDR
jgi:hypothetical protein